MARAALDWSQLTLAEKSGVGITSIKVFELGGTPLRPALQAKLRHAVESAGIVFLDEGQRVRGRKVAFGLFLADEARARPPEADRPSSDIQFGPDEVGQQ